MPNFMCRACHEAEYPGQLDDPRHHEWPCTRYNLDKARQEADRGKRLAVVDGRLAYVSPSSIAKADHDTEGGCGLKFWYRYVLRLPDPAGAAAALGKVIHSEIEDHARALQQQVFGEIGEATAFGTPLGYWSSPANMYIPRGRVLVEEPIERLTAEGLPVVGYKDLTHASGVYIDSEGEEWEDPPGTVEVIDWKTTSHFKWAKTPQQVGRTIQMVTYAADEILTPGVEWVRTSHVYLATRGRPRAMKSTTLLGRATIEERWNNILPVVRLMKDIAGLSNAADVPYNTRACPTYGGCNYRDRCPRYNSGRSLEDMFGGTMAAQLLEGENTMSLKDILKPEVTAGTKSMADQLAALEAEEAAALNAPDPKVVAFAAAWEAVNKAGLGFPALSGEAMHLWGKMAKQEPQGAGLAGAGRLGKLTISELDKMIELAKELGTVVEAPKAPAPPTVEIPLVETAQRTEISVLPPDAPESDPALASAGAQPGDLVEAPAGPAVVAETAAEKPKRGRKAKAGPDENTGEPPVTRDRPVEAGGLALYINSIPSVPYQTLDRYVDDLAARLCREFGAADIRCAPADGPLGFGKWKGALAALARETCPAGTYVAFTRGSEMDEVVADALASKAAIVVRGV